MDRKTEQKALLQRSNRVAGKLIYRTLSVIPIIIVVVLLRALFSSISANHIGSSVVIALAIVLLLWLIRFMWSAKRSISDIIDANS